MGQANVSFALIGAATLCTFSISAGRPHRASEHEAVFEEPGKSD